MHDFNSYTYTRNIEYSIVTYREASNTCKITKSVQKMCVCAYVCVYCFIARNFIKAKARIDAITSNFIKYEILILNISRLWVAVVVVFVYLLYCCCFLKPLPLTGTVFKWENEQAQKQIECTLYIYSQNGFGFENDLCYV